MIVKVGWCEGNFLDIIKQKLTSIDYIEKGRVEKIGFMELRESHRYMIMISCERGRAVLFNVILSINGKDQSICQAIFEDLNEKLPFNFNEAPDFVRRNLLLLEKIYNRM